MDADNDENAKSEQLTSVTHGCESHDYQILRVAQGLLSETVQMDEIRKRLGSAPSMDEDCTFLSFWTHAR